MLCCPSKTLGSPEGREARRDDRPATAVSGRRRPILGFRGGQLSNCCHYDRSPVGRAIGATRLDRDDPATIATAHCHYIMAIPHHKKINLSPSLSLFWAPWRSCSTHNDTAHLPPCPSAASRSARSSVAVGGVVIVVDRC